MSNDESPLWFKIYRLLCLALALVVASRLSNSVFPYLVLDSNGGVSETARLVIVAFAGACLFVIGGYLAMKTVKLTNRRSMATFVVGHPFGILISAVGGILALTSLYMLL